MISTRHTAICGDRQKPSESGSRARSLAPFQGACVCYFLPGNPSKCALVLGGDRRNAPSGMRVPPCTHQSMQVQGGLSGSHGPCKLVTSSSKSCPLSTVSSGSPKPYTTSIRTESSDTRETWGALGQDWKGPNLTPGPALHQPLLHSCTSPSFTEKLAE